jgi:hypothetical protein
MLTPRKPDSHCRKSLAGRDNLHPGIEGDLGV